MARILTDLSTTFQVTTLETSTKVTPDLVSVYSVPFAMEGTIYYWLWDSGDFILWDNGDRMRQ